MKSFFASPYSMQIAEALCTHTQCDNTYTMDYITDKKEKKIFLIFKEIKMGSGAK
jgi:hypothetical protein